jgi:hypothetical protein
MYWWGIPSHTFWRWRRLFGVKGFADTPGSQLLIQALAERGGEAMQAHTFTEAEREAKRRKA